MEWRHAAASWVVDIVHRKVFINDRPDEEVVPLYIGDRPACNGQRAAIDSDRSCVDDENRRWSVLRCHAFTALRLMDSSG